MTSQPYLGEVITQKMLCQMFIPVIFCGCKDTQLFTNSNPLGSIKFTFAKSVPIFLPMEKKREDCLLEEEGVVHLWRIDAIGIEVSLDDLVIDIVEVDEGSSN